MTSQKPSSSGLVRAIGTKPRDRSRSIKFRLLEMAGSRGQRCDQSGQVGAVYRLLLNTMNPVVVQAKRLPTEIVQGRSGLRACSSSWHWKAGTQLLNKMVPLVRQVMKRTGARIFCGNTLSEASSSGCSNLRIFGAPQMLWTPIRIQPCAGPKCIASSDAEGFTVIAVCCRGPRRQASRTTRLA